MAYNNTPHSNLKWGDEFNKKDYQNACKGQWFLGILDTQNKKVYFLPSDIGESLRYGLPLASPPAHGWQSSAMKGHENDAGINTHAGDEDGGLRQHGRVIKSYKLITDDCLGFSIVKVKVGKGLYIDRSKSTNMSIASKLDKDAKYKTNISHGGMSEKWSKVLKKWLEKNLPTKLKQERL